MQGKMNNVLNVFFFSFFLFFVLSKSNSEKTKRRQMLGRRATAENAPTHNMNRSGTDLKGEDERRYKALNYPENVAKIS